MSLNMYLGEVQSQTQSMNAVCTATIQGMEQAIQSIDAFAIDTVLQGQTYDSAKAYFAQTFRPLAQGIIYLCEELIRQNDAFPSQFQSQVASTDVIEQEIIEQIRGIDQTRAGIEVISSTLPGMQAMVGIFDAMKRKLQEKLEQLHEFNYTSSSNYDTALQLAASIAQGLAEVQSGKGFSLASGTFSTQGLNMEWTNSIQAITEEKTRETYTLDAGSEMNDSLSEESILEELGQAWNSFYVGSGKVAGAIIEGVPKVWDGIYYGSGQAVGEIIEGVPKLFDLETWKNMKNAIENWDETLPAMWHVLSDSFKKDVLNGDAESIARWGSYTYVQVGTSLFGDKGTSKVTAIIKGTNFVKVTEVKVPRIQQAFTNFIDNLSIENRFAFADTNGINLKSSFDSTAFEAEEKLSTYQFAKGVDTNTVKPGDTSPLAPGGGLNSHEARGGHLIDRHIGKTDAELLQRLQRDPRIRASSTFTDRATAERVANEVLSNPQNIVEINRWLNNPSSRRTLPLNYNGNAIIGRVIDRGSNSASDAENAVIVLKKDNQGSFIITGYPEK